MGIFNATIVQRWGDINGENVTILGHTNTHRKRYLSVSLPNQSSSGPQHPGKPVKGAVLRVSIFLF